MTIHKIAPAVVLGMLLLLPPVSCAQKPGDSKTAGPEPALVSGNNEQVSAADRERAAALVNGSVVPMEELDRAILNTAVQTGMSMEHLDAIKAQFGPRIIEQLVSGELLYQQAGSEGYAASPDKVEEAFESISKRYPDPEAFLQEMKKRGFTEDTLKESLKRQIAINSYIEGSIASSIEVTEEDIKAAYEALPVEVKASHILLQVQESDSQEKKDQVQARARELAAEARKEGADFAQLASDNSEGPSARTGGDLGFFSRGRMVKPFEDAAFDMEVGQVSDPVLTQFGYHIIKVTDRRGPGQTPLEENREKLTKDIRNNKVGSAVEKKIAQLRKAASIEILFTPPAADAAPSEAPGVASPH